MAKNERFKEDYSEGNGMTSLNRMILVDKKTGVNYLWVQDGYAGGLTPLLNEDGKPAVTPVKD